MSENDTENNLFNQSNDINITTEFFPTPTTTTTTKVILKPSVVETDILKQSLAAKPSPLIDQSNLKSTCNKFFCCYHHNITNQNETIINNSFSCQEKDDNQSNDCKDILTFCQTSTSYACLIDKTDIRCRIDQICVNEKKPNCSIQLIETAIYSSTSTTDVPSTTTNLTTTIMTTTSMF
jgi:hypothetical protein